jgi:hypothetical protein
VTAVPPLPVQLSEYVVSRVSGPTVAVPLAAFVPDQPPDAVQLVAPLPFHVSVVVPFSGTDFGEAASVTDTPEPWTVTVAVLVTVPPLPVQASVKLFADVIALVVNVPDVVFVPVHAPDAVQLVAFVDEHVSFDVPPDATDVGDADNVSVGAVALATVTVAERVIEPPDPVHASV